MARRIFANVLISVESSVIVFILEEMIMLDTPEVIDHRSPVVDRAAAEPAEGSPCPHPGITPRALHA